MIKRYTKGIEANKRFIAAANPATVLALLDELEAAEKRIAEQSAIVAAAERLVRCKGRYHSEQNYRALAALFGVTTPDLPPLEHENVHFADAAEMEISALRQHLAELEARTVTMPPKEHDNGTDSQIDINAGFANRMWQKCADAIRAAGIGVKGE
ncbi:ead/Ea22-like family protein [Salmonella enterica]|nr:ead/Ea22-like family protein [Salmonella enterica]EJQ9301965.1 ead/Ea22-like family protein [Salmonella enterica]EJW8239693.1 ead/Ea22-like family protein [Salmonella enterica]EJX8690667.1 ead/Ea22-like family protein [Salmonella enterica]